MPVFILLLRPKFSLAERLLVAHSLSGASCSYRSKIAFTISLLFACISSKRREFKLTQEPIEGKREKKQNQKIEIPIPPGIRYGEIFYMSNTCVNVPFIPCFSSSIRI